jgi:hypothetical protein
VRGRHRRIHACLVFGWFLYGIDDQDFDRALRRFELQAQLLRRMAPNPSNSVHQNLKLLQTWTLDSRL